MRRELIALRLSPAALGELREVANQQYEGNVSAAFRQLLSIGLALWKSGVRDPAEVSARLG